MSLLYQIKRKRITQTTTSTGAWSVVTSSLDDGVYKLATKVRTMVSDRPEVVGGGVIKQNVTGLR
jgi:hypothetical protein